MASAKNNHFFHILLVVVVACLAQLQDVAAQNPVMKVAGKKLTVCTGSKCEEVKEADSQEVEQAFHGLFLSPEEMRNMDRRIPVAPWDCELDFPRPSPKNCTPNVCPPCSWDNGDRCCHTCIYYRPVPSKIKTWEGKDCVTVQLANSFQYVRYGSCRDPRWLCDEPYCEYNRWFVNRCCQQYNSQLVLCVKKVKGGFWSLSLEPYKFPSYCACNEKRRVFLPRLRG